MCRFRWLAILAIVICDSASGQERTSDGRDFASLMQDADRYLRNAVYDSCELALNEAIALAEQDRRFGQMARARSQMGVLDIYRGNYPSALASIQSALTIYERMGSNEGIAECHNNIGSIYYAQKDYGRARVSYGKGLVIREQGSDRRALGISLNNMGDVSEKLGELESALEYHNASLAIWDELGSVSGRAMSLNHIAECMEKLGDIEEALRVTRQVHRELLESNGSGLSSTIVGIRIGHLLNKLGRPMDARRWCTEAYETALSVDSRQEVQKSCLCLFEAFQQLGMPAEALHYFQQHVVIRDSIFGQSMTKEVTRLEMNYAFEKKQLADSLRFVAESQLQHERIQRQRIGLVSTGSMLLLAAALGFAIYTGKRKSDSLLLNILPEATARELKRSGSAQARYFESVTVLFTDFKGFTAISENMQASQLVADLHECFSVFDHICEKHGIEKIKTIGDAYMAAGGLPIPNGTHAQDVVNAALEMAAFVAEGKLRKQALGQPFFEVRIGIHTGPVVAGIVGVRKFQYDIWGDTVNTASRMESSGEVGKVNISEATYKLVKDQFACEYRGKVEAKGKGRLGMYFVMGRSAG